MTPLWQGVEFELVRAELLGVELLLGRRLLGAPAMDSSTRSATGRQSFWTRRRSPSILACHD